MAKESKEEKALRYLTTGHVLVHEALPGCHYAKVYVTSDSGGEPYIVTHEDGIWACDCPAQIPLCAHVLACKVIIAADEYVVPESTGMDLDSLLDG